MRVPTVSSSNTGGCASAAPDNREPGGRYSADTQTFLVPAEAVAQVLRVPARSNSGGPEKQLGAGCTLKLELTGFAGHLHVV